MINKFLSSLLISVVFLLVACSSINSPLQERVKRDRDEWNIFNGEMFSIEYPSDWIFSDGKFNNSQYPNVEEYSFSVGVPESVSGGLMWTVLSYKPKGDSTLTFSKLIADSLSQTKAELAKRENITISEYSAVYLEKHLEHEERMLIFKEIFINADSTFYFINNGGVDTKEDFNHFYESFKVL